jgi:hypothetical protein
VSRRCSSLLGSVADRNRPSAIAQTHPEKRPRKSAKIFGRIESGLWQPNPTRNTRQDRRERRGGQRHDARRGRRGPRVPPQRDAPGCRAGPPPRCRPRPPSRRGHGDVGSRASASGRLGGGAGRGGRGDPCHLRAGRADTPESPVDLYVGPAPTAARVRTPLAFRALAIWPNESASARRPASMKGLTSAAYSSACADRAAQARREASLLPPRRFGPPSRTPSDFAAASAVRVGTP